MKRRDFLSLVSTAGIGVIAGDFVGCSGSGVVHVGDGEILLSHRRQGFGYPITVTLRNEFFPGGPPSRVHVLREGCRDWSAVVSADTTGFRPTMDGWTFKWPPPVVHPTAIELSDEVIRFRFAVLKEEGAGVSLSEPLEVVCGQRGWGC